MLSTLVLISVDPAEGYVVQDHLQVHKGHCNSFGQIKVQIAQEAIPTVCEQMQGAQYS
jgi:hypothetical protein